VNRWKIPHELTTIKPTIMPPPNDAEITFARYTITFQPNVFRSAICLGSLPAYDFTQFTRRLCYKSGPRGAHYASSPIHSRWINFGRVRSLESLQFCRPELTLQAGSASPIPKRFSLGCGHCRLSDRG